MTRLQVREKKRCFDLTCVIRDHDQRPLRRNFLQVGRVNSTGDASINSDNKRGEPKHGLSFRFLSEMDQAQIISNSSGSSSRVSCEPLRQMNSPSA